MRTLFQLAYMYWRLVFYQHVLAGGECIIHVGISPRTEVRCSSSCFCYVRDEKNAFDLQLSLIKVLASFIIGLFLIFV